jgi:2-polyprenyl-3-methyl-5-hydroxy-6-metoxy-1,4-benzoquinol methylase
MAESAGIIGTESVPACPLCGYPGTTHADALHDYVFAAPGRWRLARCAQEECGLFWLDPRPTPAEMPKAYRRYYTHEDATVGQLGPRNLPRRLYHAIRKAWWQQHLGYAPGGRRGWRVLLAPLAYLHPCGTDAISVEAMFLPAPLTGARLLEIGCGNGYQLERMRALGWSVEGVEFDPACVALVEKKGIVCRLGDLREQDHAAASFDAIYTGNVIEHVYDPVGFIAECARLLRPGGRLVCVTPNTASVGHAHYRADWRGLEPPRHLQIFHCRNLRTLAERAGLRCEQARTTNRGAYYILGMSAAIRDARKTGLERIDAWVDLLSFAGLLRQAFGRVVRWVQPDRGEELVVIARKP